MTEDTITLGLINFRSATRALGPAIADPTTRMLQAYFQWLNDRGGVAGRKLKLLVCDDGGDVTRGRACFEKLQDKVFAFLPGESFVTGGIHEALAKAKVPWLSWGWFTSEWQDPYMFPCHGNGERETANIAEWLAVNVKPKTVGILYLNDAEDIASRDITKKIMKRHGIKVVAEVAQEWDSPDESHHVLAMRAANPDAIVAPTWPTSLAKFFHDAEQQDYAPPMGIYAKHLIADPGQGPIFGEYAKDRFYSINSWIISGGIGNTPEEETLPGNEFMKMLTREYTGYENNGLHMKHMLGHHITQSSVACAVILADVVGQLGPKLTRTGLIDGLESQSFETGMGQTLKWPKGDHDAEPYAFHKEYLYLWTHGDADGFGVKRIRPDPVTPSMAGLTNYPD